MRSAVRVYALLIVAPLLLGVLVLPTIIFSGARFSSLFPYAIGVNHVLLFALTVLAIKADGLGLRAIGWGKSVVAVEVLIGIGAGLILTLMNRFLTGPLVSAAALAFGDLGGLPLLFDNSPAWVIAVTFFAGVTHETLYRGYALRILGERNGMVRAVLISSIFFAMFHWPLGLLTVISVVPDGIFLCLLAQWRGSLWAPLAAHAGFNLVSLFVAF